MDFSVNEKVENENRDYEDHFVRNRIWQLTHSNMENIIDWDISQKETLIKGLGKEEWQMMFRLLGLEDNQIDTYIYEGKGKLEEMKFLALNGLLDTIVDLSWKELKCALIYFGKKDLVDKLCSDSQICSEDCAYSDEQPTFKCSNEILLMVVFSKHLSCFWSVISRRLGLENYIVAAIDEDFESVCEKLYQAFLKMYNAQMLKLEFTDLKNKFEEIDDIPSWVIKQIGTDLAKFSHKFGNEKLLKDEQMHVNDVFDLILISHSSRKHLVTDLNIQMQKFDNIYEQSLKKSIQVFYGAHTPKTQSIKEWIEIDCRNYVERYFGNVDFFSFNYDSEDILTKGFEKYLKSFNQPSFLLKNYDIYEHFCFLKMEGVIANDWLRANINCHVIDLIGFEARNRTIYFIKVSNGKGVKETKDCIDACAEFVRMFLLLHQIELKGKIACLLSLVLVPDEEQKKEIHKVCRNCEPFVLTSKEFIDFGKEVKARVKNILIENKKKVWKDLVKYDFKNFKYSLGNIFGFVATRSGNLIPSLCKDISIQLENVKIFLYPQQITLANTQEKRLLIKGCHGSGKTIFGRMKLKELAFENPDEFVFYVNWGAESEFTAEMNQYVNTINKHKNIVCTSRQELPHKKLLFDGMKWIESMTVNNKSRAHVIFDEVPLSEIGEEEILSFCDILNNPFFINSYCMLLCQAMLIDRSFKKDGISSLRSFSLQSEYLKENAGFKEQELKESVRNPCKIKRIAEIATTLLERTSNIFDNKVRSEKSIKDSVLLLRNLIEDEARHYSDANIRMNDSASSFVVSTDNDDNDENDGNDDNVVDDDNIELRKENKAIQRNFNLEASMKSLSIPGHATNENNFIENRYSFQRSSGILHRIEGNETFTYYPFHNKNEHSSFEKVYILMLCWKNIIENSPIGFGEPVVVIHFEETTPEICMKALQLYAESEQHEEVLNNVTFKHCLDVYGMDYKNVVIYISTDEYHMQHYLVEAITRCTSTLVFLVTKENDVTNETSAVGQIMQNLETAVWIDEKNNEHKLVEVFGSEDLDFDKDEMKMLHDVYSEKLELQENQATIFNYNKDLIAGMVTDFLESQGLVDESKDDIDIAQYDIERSISSSVFSSDDEDLNEYDMKGDICGKCLILNFSFFFPPWQNPRRGTEVDVSRLTRLFTWLKFSILVYKDLKKEDLERILKQEAADEDRSNSKSKCLVVFILSHGSEDGVYTADGYSFKIEDIIRYFNCSSWVGKPKLFFLQTCQDTKEEKVVYFGATDRAHDDERPLKELVPTADQFVFLSSTPGPISWKSTNDESWFIQTFCTVFENKAHESDLNTMVSQINKKIAIMTKQLADNNVANMMSPYIQSNLRKFVRFHPDQPFKEFYY